MAGSCGSIWKTMSGWFANAILQLLRFVRGDVQSHGQSKYGCMSLNRTSTDVGQDDISSAIKSPR